MAEARPASRGPAWLGIGAQRAGTTWFTNLLVQHPEVSLSAGGRKELHYLTMPLAHGWNDDYEQGYRTLFDDATARLPGEFTPVYLRALWAAPLALRVCRPDAPIIVLLRDPIDRFESAMRLASTHFQFPGPEPSQALRVWTRTRGVAAQWTGMYAAQLDAWERVLGRRRLIVLQYERLRDDPQPAVERVWEALGLRAVALRDVRRPSRTARSPERPWTLDLVPGFRDELWHLYRPEVEQLRLRWGVDVGRWPNFA